MHDANKSQRLDSAKNRFGPEVELLIFQQVERVAGDQISDNVEYCEAIPLCHINHTVIRTIYFRE